jgi:hypothetical protein
MGTSGRRRNVSICAAVVAGLLAVIAGAGPAAATVRPGFITNAYAGLCLDAESDGGGNPAQYGDQVQLWECNDEPQQTWSFSDNPNVGWEPIVNGYGRLCLDAETDNGGKPNQNGDKVQLYACTGSVQQQWRYDTANHRLINRYAGLCLDAKTESATVNAGWNGDKVQLWSCSGAFNQRWDLYFY